MAIHTIDLYTASVSRKDLMSSPMYCNLTHPRNCRRSSSPFGAIFKISFSNSRQAMPHRWRGNLRGAKSESGLSTMVLRDANTVLRRWTSSFKFLSVRDEFFKLSIVMFVLANDRRLKNQYFTRMLKVLSFINTLNPFNMHIGTYKRSFTYHQH